MKSAERGLFLQKDDTTALVQWSDVPAALGLLTRLPIKVDTEAAIHRGAASAWAYPVVGICVALISLLIVTGLSWFGVTSWILAGIYVALGIIITGAMHEDGLADSADGLWGGWTKERRLEIMKDSRIGTYGVLALILAVLLKAMAIHALIEAGSVWGPLVVCAAASRALMVVLMSLLPNARDTGLSQSVGRPEQSTMLVACAVGLGIGLVALPSFVPALMIVSVLVTLACGAIARAKIGGQTGDILGATQQITEIVLLITCMSLMG